MFSLLLFFLGPSVFSGIMRLTLTADSVKNNSVKLSIKFMVLEIQSKGRRRFKIQEAKCGDFFSNMKFYNSKYNNNTSGTG